MAEQSVTLQPGESKVITFEATPHEARTYQVSVDSLAGSFSARAVPNIELISLTWDAEPPFDTGSQHYLTVTMRNLAPARFTYQLQSYLNNEQKWGTSITLEANQEATIVSPAPFYFTAEGTYTIRIEALYNGQLLDEISSAVAVSAPVVPPFINGQVLIGYVLIDGEWVQIIGSNQWPALLLPAYFKVRNTGNTTASFYVVIGGGSTSAITLVPGGSGFVEGTFWAKPGSCTIVLYGDGSAVQSDVVQVTTY